MLAKNGSTGNSARKHNGELTKSDPMRVCFLALASWLLHLRDQAFWVQESIMYIWNGLELKSL
jgi:hypothetical protein